MFTFDMVILRGFIDNNEYFGRLTRTGPKR